MFNVRFKTPHLRCRVHPVVPPVCLQDDTCDSGAEGPSAPGWRPGLPGSLRHPDPQRQSGGGAPGLCGTFRSKVSVIDKCTLQRQATYFLLINTEALQWEAEKTSGSISLVFMIQDQLYFSLKLLFTIIFVAVIPRDATPLYVVNSKRIVKSFIVLIKYVFISSENLHKKRL